MPKISKKSSISAGAEPAEKKSENSSRTAAKVTGKVTARVTRKAAEKVTGKTVGKVSAKSRAQTAVKAAVSNLEVSEGVKEKHSQTAKSDVSAKSQIRESAENSRTVRESKTFTRKQKDEILAILSVGCSRKVAARYVGCLPREIQKTAKEDADFALALQHAEEQAEITSMKSINAAARQERYWKAAAWILERKNPEEFRLRSPGTFNAQQLNFIVEHLSKIIAEEVKAPAYRKRVLARFDEFLKNLGESKNSERNRSSRS